MTSIGFYLADIKIHKIGSLLKQWNSTFFAFSLTIEGGTEKVLNFITPPKSIYNRNFGFVEQKMYF
jgi:hypothetical protein